MTRPFAGVFEKMDFPPYQFKEYPKWLTIDGVTQIVRNQREEIALVATTPEAALNDPVVVEKNKLTTLLAEARLREARLEKELAEAKAQASGPVISIETKPVSMAVAEDDPSKPVPLSGPLGERFKAKSEAAKPPGA